MRDKNDSDGKKRENIWTDECEELLAEWSEKASCYRWLHGRCEKSYRKWYYCFSIIGFVRKRNNRLYHFK